MELLENIYKIYREDKKRKSRNLYLYTSFCTVMTQLFIGNDETSKITFLIAYASVLMGTIKGISYYKNKYQYNQSIENLINVAKELMLLGYDLDDDAIVKSTFYVDGLIEYQDKYDNMYFIYETKENDETKYYSLISDDVDECMGDDGMHKDITKVIKEGLNKSKQNK